MNSDKTQLTFAVPSGTKDGGYAVGVTTSAGASQNTLPLTVGSGTTVTNGTQQLTVNPTSGPVPLTVQATVVGSQPGDTISFDFGDGSASVFAGTDTTKSYTYQNAKNYTVKATDNGTAIGNGVTVVAGPAHVDNGGGNGGSGNGGGNGNGTGNGTTVTTGTAGKTGGSSSGSSSSTGKPTLASSGGSLAVNLGLAALFSLITTYALLHRRSA